MPPQNSGTITVSMDDLNKQAGAPAPSAANRAPVSGGTMTVDLDSLNRPEQNFSTLPADDPQWVQMAQNAIDDLTAIEPLNKRPGVGGHIATAVGDIGSGVLSPLSLIAHPVASGKALLNTLAPQAGLSTIFPDTPSIPESMAQSIKASPGGTALNLLGGVATGEGLKAIAPTRLLDTAGEGLKASGGRMIDRTVGVLKGDKARGAQPGRAYLEGGGTPALSMRGLAEKASDIHERTGQQIGNAIDAATQRGTLIPVDEAVRPIAEPLNRAHSVMSGPGGSGAEPVENLSATFRPAIRTAARNGGFTPRGLFDLKRNVAQNTSWGDPTQIGLKSVRQQITGGIGGALENHVPELEKLNPIYQGTGKLANRANLRTETGQLPLTAISRKTLGGVLGAGLGYSSGHPSLALVPLAADTIPVKTAVATGLFGAGHALPAIPRTLPAAVPLAGVAGRRGPKPSPENERNEQK